MKKALYLLTLILILSACVPDSIPSQTIIPSSTLSSSTPTFTIEPATTPTLTPEPTATTIPILYEVTFFAFRDYDGNGVQDIEREPNLPNIVASIEDKSCITNEDGACTIEQVPAGSCLYVVNDPNGEYRWIMPSEWEGIEIGREMDLVVEEDQIIYLPLGEGRVLLPFSASVIYDIWSWYDRDEELGLVENWLGETDTVAPDTWSSDITVKDDHRALDYVFPTSPEIVAADAATIVSIGTDLGGYGEDIIEYETDYGIIFNIGHITPVDGLHIGQRVYRGEVIGYVLPRALPITSFNDYPYLFHFGLYHKDHPSNYDYLDPYSPNLFITSDYDLARIDDP